MRLIFILISIMLRMLLDLPGTEGERRERGGEGGRR
jgi:hypothetical protein